MNMYNRDNQIVGTKTIQQGQGLQKPDGSFGNGVTMKFNNPASKQNSMINSLSQIQQKSKFPNNYKNGIKRPNLSLTLDDNNKEIGNFLQYLTDKRNAGMQQQYDSMNMKNNQFLSNLANNKYQAKQNRYQKEYLQKQRLTQQQKQYDQTFDFNAQKFNRTHDFEMQKYLHPNYKPTQQGNGEKYKLDRTKIFTKDPTSLVPEWEKLDKKTKVQVRDSYINNGTIPKLEAYDGKSWFEDDYKIAGENQQQSQQPQKIDTDKMNRFKQYVAMKNAEIMNRDETY